MKKMLIFMPIALVVIVSIAWAASINVRTFGADPSYTEKFPLISTTTNTGYGSVYKLGKPFKNVSCIMSNPTGTAPGQVTFKVWGGLDDTNLVTLASTSASSWPTSMVTTSASSPDVLYVRGQIVSWLTETSSQLRLECVAAH